MKKMLIAAHGRLAEGLFSALALILGEKEHIGYINAFIGDTPLEKQIDNYFASVGKEDQVLVVTDAFFGSVNQKLLMKRPENSIIVTGANLPLVLELAGFLEGGEPIDEEKVKAAVSQAREQLMVADSRDVPQAQDDFDF